MVIFTAQVRLEGSPSSAPAWHFQYILCFCMCSDSHANSFQLTWHPSEGGGDCISEEASCQGILPSTLCPQHAQGGRWNPLLAGYMPWWLSMGEASRARSTRLPWLCQHTSASWGPSGPFPTSRQHQPASRHLWGKQSPLQPHHKMPARSQQPASHITLALAKTWTPCQLSIGCRTRTPKPAWSPISGKLTCLNKINK